MKIELDLDQIRRDVDAVGEAAEELLRRWAKLPRWVRGLREVTITLGENLPADIMNPSKNEPPSATGMDTGGDREPREGE